jgi:2-polyprenyl-3-methyl-5-hydroxy-6-metoxy-1,4-benzoquinol methylase/glycosyltransferase involved in cell wall biosynthesis
LRIVPTMRLPDEAPACPLCGSKATSLLRWSESASVWRCGSSAFDFAVGAVAPEAPGSQRAKTPAHPWPWLVELLANLAATHAAPSVLDLRCGAGERLSLAGEMGWQVFGVEALERDRAAARAAFPGAYVAESVEEIPPHRFELILMLDVIQYQADPYALFYELAAKGAIAPDTVVVTTTPNSHSDALARDPALWLGQAAPRAAGFYSATALAELLQFLRFTQVQIGGSDPNGDPSTDGPPLGNFRTLWCRASGCDFTQFMQERYVPGTWSEIAAYEHVPRYVYARGFAQGKRVLDFGCGTGYGGALLAEVARSVTGLDISEDSLGYARGRYRDAGIHFIRSDDFGAALPAAGFDLIVCFEVIEHVNQGDQIELIRAFRRLLAPGGQLLISTPNPAVTALYGANPYHLHELTYPEFEGRLKACFPHVEILVQSIHATVLLRPAHAPISGKALVSGQERAEVREPAVYVAVCSDSPIGELGATVFPDLSRNHVAMRIEALRHRNQQLIERFDRVQLATGLNKVREDLARIEAARIRAEDRASDLAAREHLLSAQVAKLSDQLSEAAKDRTRLRDCLADATSAHEQSLAGTEAELSLTRRREEEAWAALADAQRQVGHFRVASDAAHSQLRERELELSEIAASTSWRAIKYAAPLLRGMRPVVRPAVRAAYRIARRVGAVSPVADVLAQGADARASAQSAPLQTPRNLALETRLDPVWNPNTTAFELHYDTSHAADSSGAGARPYIVKPLTPVDPQASRAKVLHIIPNVFIGGSTQLVIDIVQHLSDRFEHEVLTSALWSGGSHVGLVVHHVPRTSASEMAEVIARVKPDLIHVHYWGLSDTPWYDAAFLAMTGSEIPVIENINTPVLPLIHEKVRSYIFVSKYVREVFGSQIVDSSSTHVIYPGIDLSLFQTPISGPDAENAIGMVYRLEDDKLNADAIDLFIEVVRRRPRTKVYIIGGGRFLQPYLERTEAAGVRENFRFTGYVPYETLPEWYDKFAIFVAPVWRESFGQVAPFAMSKGGVVAGYAVGALPEILDGSETLAATLEQAASIIVDLLGDPPRMQELGRRNRERALELFDVRTMVARYADQYDRLLA